MALELSVNKSETLPSLISGALGSEADERLVLTTIRLDEGGALQVEEYPTLAEARRDLESLAEAGDTHSSLRQVVVLAHLRESLRSGPHRAWVLADWSAQRSPELVIHPQSPPAIWELASLSYYRLGVRNAQTTSVRPDDPFTHPAPRYAPEE